LPGVPEPAIIFETIHDDVAANTSLDFVANRSPVLTHFFQQFTQGGIDPQLAEQYLVMRGTEQILVIVVPQPTRVRISVSRKSLPLGLVDCRKLIAEIVGSTWEN